MKFSINRIKDRYNKSFAAVCDCTECCSEILNSVPLSLHKDRELIDRLRPYSARLMFSVESDKEVSEIIDGFYGMLFENTKYEPDFEYTRGHLLRGVE